MSTRFSLLLLCAVFLVASLSRLTSLAADPPWWMQGAFITDEGWWADSARGQVLFKNPYADDFGTAFLITPLYNWLLAKTFAGWGVGLGQARLPAAFANVLLIVLTAVLLWRKAGPREALLGSLLLACSPFFWSYGRVGMQESAQALLIAVAFVFLIHALRHWLAALGCGLSLAAAIAIKPNAIQFGCEPLALAALVLFMADFHAAPREAKARTGRAHAAAAGWAVVGLALGLAAIFVLDVLPNWDKFWPMAHAESGSRAITWRDRLKAPGLFLVSTEMRHNIKWPIFWTPARWSPAIMLIMIFYLIELILRARGGLARLAQSFSRLELATVAWVLGTWAVLGVSFDQSDRRFIPLMPPLAILAALYGTRGPQPWILPSSASMRDRPRLLKFGFAFLLWAVILLPVLIVLKPWITRMIMQWTIQASFIRKDGLAYDSLGTLFMAIWFLLLAGLALWQAPRAAQLGLALLRRFPLRPLVGVLLLGEAWVIGANLHRADATLVRRQAELRRYLRDGETVMGHVAATVCLPLAVRTVRRVSPYDATPPPNPDVWDRLQPRSILEMTGRNYTTAPPYYQDLLDRGHYQSVYHFEVGPYRRGIPRYRFELFQRR